MAEAQHELDVEWKEPDFENGWDQQDEEPTNATKWKDGVSGKSKTYITLDDIIDHTAPNIKSLQVGMSPVNEHSNYRVYVIDALTSESDLVHILDFIAGQS